MSKKIKIGIDPGHGGKDVGACGNGVREKDITLAVSLDVRDRLIAHGFDVYMTRTTDVFVGDASARGTLLGNAGVDYGISIHVNSATSPQAEGAEIITPMGESYAYTEAAIKANLSEIGPFRRVFSRDYSTGANYDRPINNGVFVKSYKGNTDYYGVVRGAWKKGVSANIVELFFISNAKDVARYQSHHPQYVEAIVKGICTSFQVPYQKPNQATPPSTNKPSTNKPSTGHDWYQVVVGSYTSKATASNVKTRLEAKGYTGVWIKPVTIGNTPYSRVICGSYATRESAEIVKSKLVKAQYTGVWINVESK